MQPLPIFVVGEILTLGCMKLSKLAFLSSKTSTISDLCCGLAIAK